VNEHQNTRRRLHLALYVMLLASVACTLLFTKQLWEGFGAGNLPLIAPLLAPVAFAAFLAIYTVDRWILIRKRNYPVLRAFIQVAVSLVFLTWLVQSQSRQFRAASEVQAKPNVTSSLLEHREARVRAAACELMGLRGEIEVAVQVEALALGDRSDQVRARCSEAVAALAPNDSSTAKPAAAAPPVDTTPSEAPAPSELNQ
jgi:hypothetical protein